VDEVEGGRRVGDPFAAAVVDFEGAVFGDHAWLHGREVCADYGCGREFVGDVAGRRVSLVGIGRMDGRGLRCPDAGSGACYIVSRCQQ
jgi:hypothetical protein